MSDFLSRWFPQPRRVDTLRFLRTWLKLRKISTKVKKNFSVLKCAVCYVFCGYFTFGSYPPLGLKHILIMFLKSVMKTDLDPPPTAAAESIYMVLMKSSLLQYSQNKGHKDNHYRVFISIFWSSVHHVEHTQLAEKINQ